MEMYEASVIERESEHFLKLVLGEKEHFIPLTKDEPNDVKSVFNELIIHLKKVEFNFIFNSTSSDLYTQVAHEYIKQLNGELVAVRRELEYHDLLE